jgi:hypothetical protein
VIVEKRFSSDRRGFRFRYLVFLRSDLVDVLRTAASIGCLHLLKLVCCDSIRSRVVILVFRLFFVRLLLGLITIAMGRTAGAKDKVPRKRKSGTSDALAERKRQREETKRNKEQNAGAVALVNFVANLRRSSAGSAPERSDLPTIPDGNPPPESTDLPVIPPAGYEEAPPPLAETIQVTHCVATADGGNVVADLDDDVEEETTAMDEGVMQIYLKSIKLRLQAEFSSKNNHENWLRQFLDQNGYWIRTDRATFMCNKLGLRFKEHEKFYFRDVRVWFPEVEGGQTCMPVCPSCQCNANVRVHGHTTAHPARRIVTLSTHYYLMSRQYFCRSCEAIHQRKKEEGKANLGQFVGVQYSFMIGQQYSKRDPSRILFGPTRLRFLSF